MPPCLQLRQAWWHLLFCPALGALSHSRAHDIVPCTVLKAFRGVGPLCHNACQESDTGTELLFTPPAPYTGPHSRG